MPALDAKRPADGIRTMPAERDKPTIQYSWQVEPKTNIILAETALQFL